MKFLLSFLFCINIAFAQQAKDTSFTISGTFSDLPDGVQVTLNHPSSSDIISSTVSKAKKFVLKGSVPFAGASRIQFKGNKIDKAYDIFLGAEKIILNGTLKDIAKTKVTGSALQTTFQKFVSTFEPMFAQLNKINTNINATTDANKRSGLFNDFNTAKAKTSVKIDSFLNANLQSPVSSFLIFVTKELFTEEPVITANRLAKLTGDAKQSIYAQQISKEIEAAMFGSIGSMAMDFVQNDTADKPVSLASFRGKYVLLDFWASWCGPCRMENPNVVSAFNKFKNKNFTVLGVSLDRPGHKSDWINAIANDNLTWTHVSDLKFWGNEVAQLYKIGSIPQNFLIDPTGKIVGKNLRGMALEEKLCELLGCN